MKRLYYFLLIFCMGNVKSVAQGYLGKNAYASVELLHPAFGGKDYRISGGLLLKRFYALDIQLNYTLMNLDLYSQYNLTMQYGFAQQEYHAGNLQIEGKGVRVSFRTFNKASSKAAPIGWYMNYSVEYMHGVTKGTLTLKATEGYSNGNFIENSTPLKFNKNISFYSLILTPGKTIQLTRYCYLDLGLDIGLRIYAMKDADWIIDGNQVYNLEPIFKNNINKHYQYKSIPMPVHDNKTEIIYEPSLKIGYLF